MKKSNQVHLDKVLSHLYINPLEKCNLRCKICYTKKTSPILKEKEILGFIKKYREYHPLDIITFCGGEVFTLPYFTGLVNKLTRFINAEVGLCSTNLQTQASLRPDSIGTRDTSHKAGSSEDLVSHKPFPHLYSKGIFVQVITNGTVDKLEGIKNPNAVNLIVSLDGLKDYHDSNRGIGNFNKSIKFLKKAIRLGFHTEVFTVVTKQNYDQIDEFKGFLKKDLGSKIHVTFHPRKPSSYLLHHPISNIEGQVEGFNYLSDKQMTEIMQNRKTFPPKELGCFQIALMSDGNVYGCCEGTVPLGKIGDKIEKLFGELRERLELWDKENKIKGCLGCSQPDFICGIKKFI